MKKSIGIWVIIIVLIFSQTSSAQMSMPAIFSNNMVLQREINIPVWGTAKQGSKIKVELAGNAVELYADKKERWLAYLPKIKAGGPYSLKVSGEQDITLST